MVINKKLRLIKDSFAFLSKNRIVKYFLKRRVIFFIDFRLDIVIIAILCYFIYDYFEELNFS